MIPAITFLLGSLWGIALVAWGTSVTLPAWTAHVGRCGDSLYQPLARTLNALQARLQPSQESRQ